MKFVFQGRGQVQEQRAGDQQPEAASLPHQVGQVPGKNRVSHQRSPEGLEDRPTEGRHRHLKVVATTDPVILILIMKICKSTWVLYQDPAGKGLCFRDSLTQKFVESGGKIRVKM